MPVANHRDEEESSLAALRAPDVLGSDPEAEFDALVRAAALVCAVPISLISLIDADRQWIKANVGMPNVAPIPRDFAFCVHAVLGNELFEIPDATEDSRFADNPWVAGEPHIRFYAGAPIELSDGTRVGTLCVIDKLPRKLDESQREVLRQLAIAAASALEGRRAVALARRASHDLVESEARFRTLSEFMPLGVFYADREGSCTYTNPRWQQIYGLTSAQSLGQGWTRALYESDLQEVSRRWRGANASGEFAMEFRVRQPAGQVRHVRSTARVLRDERNSVTGFVGAVEDITERRLMEQRLRESEAMLDRAGRLAGVGGWRIDLGSNDILWSDQTCRILEVEPGHQPSLEEALGYYPPAARESIAQALERATRDGTAFDLEMPLVTARGRAIWVRAIGQAEFEDGQAVRVFGAFQDITERRQLEQSLAATNIQLQQLYEQTPALLLSLDQEGQVRAVSDLWLMTLGYKREEVVGKRLGDFLTDASREHVQTPDLANLFARGRCLRVPYQFVYRDGRRMDALLSAIVERHADNRPRLALAVLEDVTEVLARTEELRREQILRIQIEHHARELDRLLAERGDMLNVLAHEVRQPLNNASAALQSATAVLAERGEKAASEQVRLAQAVLGVVMAGVDNTLAVASLLAGAGEITRADADIDMLIGIAVGDMPAHERGRIKVARLTAARTIWADVGLVRLALRNLLANALEFSAPDAAVVVRITDSDAPLAVIIDVIDRGPGFAVDLRARLFQRGVRGTGADGKPSHGLGLYIVRRAMELQGGSAMLMDSGPSGTTMRLQFNEAPGASRPQMTDKVARNR